MTLLNKPGIFGNDGESPLYDPEPFWKEYSINDLFMGGSGLNKIIPKVGDHARDPEIYATYKVVEVSEITYVPKLERIYPYGMSFELPDIDILFGVGFGTNGDVYRLHVNNNVYPYAACPDSSLKIAGSLCKKARVYRLLEDGSLETISKVYDSSGKFVSDMISLETVSMHQVENYSTKVIPPFKTTTRLKDNDRVIVYCYSDDNNVVSKRELLVEESSFVRSIDESKKYVTHISLESPYLSKTTDFTINYPLNLPTASLNITGKVHYSNGETKEMIATGGQFRIEGLEQLLSSIEGQERDITAFYMLGANEVSFSSSGLDGRQVSAHYKLKVSNENLSYSVKLFPCLEYRGDIYGYFVKWYLLNMDRNLIFDVTNKVKFLEATGEFNPFGYGYLQRKQVSVNLREVSNLFTNMNHTQVVDFTLFGKPTEVNSTAYSIRTEAVGTKVYGLGVLGSKVSNDSINISLGLSTKEEWLEALYSNMSALVDYRVESKEPTPTHFVVTYNGVSTEYSVDEWNSDLNVTAPVTVNSSVTVKFIKRASSGVMNLSICNVALV